MKVNTGWTVKVADIGTLAKVVSAGRGYADLAFGFPEGTEICECPYSIITDVISRGEDE